MPSVPLQSYPRPQFKRESYVNLNGWWDFTVSASAQLPAHYDRQILVPYCPESLLSGIHTHFPEGSSLFYRRHLPIKKPKNGNRVLLHFGAVDQYAEIYVNQKAVCSHVGGYDAFSCDITDFLQEENELAVRATDDLRSDVLPYGKQTLKRGGMWYTPVSGIWQTVWLEEVPQSYITGLDIQTDLNRAVITVTPGLCGTVLFEGQSIPLQDGKAVLKPREIQCWSPENPHLYTFTVEVGADRVESYFALRTLSVKTVNGVPRLCLNEKPYFFHGLLDQGYYSDGLFTPASEENFENDILQMKALGFNTLRKHIKVEPEQFYYLCDKLGMVVFQDMVNNGRYSFLRDTALPTIGLQRRSDRRLHRDPESRKAFLQGMEKTVQQLKNHPCVCYWTIFNEGWGQFDSDRVCRHLRALDSSRMIDTTSGWFRGKNTDVESLHIYFGSWKKLKSKERPLVLSEFGGYCYAVERHLFNPQKSYGYKACKTQEDFCRDLEKLYTERIIPAARKGLCAAIYTQVSDVEDEINGLLTYDRRVCKVQPEPMLKIAAALREAAEEGENL